MCCLLLLLLYTELDMALQIIGGHTYERVVGYSYSNGGLILLNYLMESQLKDTLFTHFVFVSPWLDFDSRITPERLVEYVIAPATNIGLLDESTNAAPNEKGISSYGLKLWSRYRVNPRVRAVYRLRQSLGFITAVRNAQSKVQSRSSTNPITMKPYLLFTCPQDPVLDHDEIVRISKCMGPRRTHIQVDMSGHDPLTDMDHSKSTETQGYLRSWLASI